ncbi:MAG: hypothetical protein ACE5OZ_22475 [Candidatus Heimdallarchaeota archaeon]
MIDWLADPLLDWYRKTPAIPTLPPVNNSLESQFWAALDADPAFEVVILPPTGSLYQLTSPNLEDYLTELAPDVVVLANLGVELFDRWGLSTEERLALFDWLETGHGLISTGGTFFDMRIKSSPEQEVLIGAKGHLNRLYAEEWNLTRTLEEIRASVGAASGLGFLQVLQEIREWVGEKLYEAGATNPYLKAAAPIVWSMPLMLPNAIPFSGKFGVSDATDPLLTGIAGDFSVNLHCPMKTKDGLYCSAQGMRNTTSMGWQLNYPELLAKKMVQASATILTEINTYVTDLVNQTLGIIDNNIPTILDPVFPDVVPINSSFLNELIANISATLTEGLDNLLAARMDLPSEITIPISFTIGSYTVDEALTIPIPIEIQQLLKPARIVAESDDGRAAVLRYEAGNHRAVHFTFDPALGGSMSQQLMRNSLQWASGSPPTPPATTLVGDLGIPTALVSSVEAALPAGVSLKDNTTKVQQPGQTYSYEYQLNATPGAVVVYTADGVASVSISKDGATLTSSSQTSGEAQATLISTSATGTYQVNISLTGTAGLMGATAIAIYEGAPEAPPSSSEPPSESSTPSSIPPAVESSSTSAATNPVLIALGAFLVVTIVSRRKKKNNGPK